MTNYTPSDFTDIRGPEEKPTVVGWYPNFVFKYDAENAYKKPRNGLSDYQDWWFWDGMDWRSSDSCCSSSMCVLGYWFGLKEKP